MGIRFKIILILCIFVGANSFSSETDNFTDRDLLKIDALPVLDAKINKILETAVVEARSTQGNHCSNALLRQEILRWVRPDPTGQLEVWLNFTTEVDHTHVGINQSIYQEVTFGDAPILWTVGIARTILLNGQIVGNDKIGHFFFQGLEYYDLVKNGKPLEKVLIEDHGEDGIWGLKTSGVKSYADMATNYQGYRFWSQLTGGPNPYVVCDEKLGWMNQRKFTWADYVNPLWDEAINCSEMIPSIQVKVERYLANRGWSCPIVPDACHDAVKLDHAEYFLSPKCKAAAEKSFLSPI